MGYEVEMRSSIWERLEELAELKDETVTSLVDKIVSEYISENYESIIEGSQDEEDSDLEFEETDEE